MGVEDLIEGWQRRMEEELYRNQARTGQQEDDDPLGVLGILFYDVDDDDGFDLKFAGNVTENMKNGT